MELAHALTRYAHAAGRWQGAWRFANPDQRKTHDFATVSAAWEVFRRDAGRGDVGREHTLAEGEGVLTTTDPRRDGVLFWLADHGVPAIAKASAVLIDAVDARRGFTGESRTLLEVAEDSVTKSREATGPVTWFLAGVIEDDDSLLAPLISLAAMVDRLRADPAFMEGSGDQVQHQLPGGKVSHYVPAEAGATWALNLALMAKSASIGIASMPGLVSRGLFRAGTDPEAIASGLVEGATQAMSAGYGRLDRTAQDWERGKAALAHLSRNARAREAWELVAATGAISRRQLARALAMSRAGADIQAHVLANASLATLGPAGAVRLRVPQTVRSPSTSAELPSLGPRVAALDADLAAIDRLLARNETSIRPPDERAPS